jgi:hypothetical protein
MHGGERVRAVLSSSSGCGDRGTQRRNSVSVVVRRQADARLTGWLAVR